MYNVSVEYYRVCELAKLLSRHERFHKIALQTCIERWNITNSNILPYSRVQSPDCKLIEELKSKKKLTLSSSFEEFVETLDTLYSRNIQMPEPRISARGTPTIVTIKCGDLEFTIPSSRFTLLNKKKERVAALLLRYNNHHTRMHHGIPPNITRLLQSEFQCTMECFASPLNRTLDHYCSMYEEDLEFGSSGNFFDYDPLTGTTTFSQDRFEVNQTHIGHTLCPPHIESLLSFTARRVIDTLKRAQDLNLKLRYFILFPTWEDAEAYITLEKSEFLVYKEILLKKQHQMYDFSKAKRMQSSLNNTVFILQTGNLGNNFDKLSKILKL